MRNEEQIQRLFEDGDRALISADVAAMKRIYAEDYMQGDESGHLSTRQEIIDRLTSEKIRFITITSDARRIRFLRDDVAIVHGSEEDMVERAEARSLVRYFYMDVVMKREGHWRIVASQLAKAES